MASDFATRLPEGWSAGDDEHGTFAVHDRHGAVLRLLPQGTYRIGMSDLEYAAAQRLAAVPNFTLTELTPVVDVRIPSDLLVGDRPITVRLAGDVGVELSSEDLGFPAMLTRDEAVIVAERLGCRLPHEAEWEAGCRAGSSSLFFWGDDLPSTAELDRWLSWDLEEDTLPRNAFGLGGLFFGEWCDERFRVSHAPDAELARGAYVIKGGGAQFWPWQDDEWVWCASAMRMPSTALFADQRCAARLVLAVLSPSAAFRECRSGSPARPTSS